MPGFDTLMTSGEKAKLYTAIGYSETAVNPNLPKNVSALKCNAYNFTHWSLECWIILS